MLQILLLHVSIPIVYTCTFLQVDEWYDWYELSNGVQGKIKRKIYIATDEPSVIKEARYK